MTAPKLTDTQLVILTQAAQHPRLALTIPPRLKGGAVSKVIGPLLAKGFVEEVEHAPDLPVYRTGEDGSRIALVIANAGLTAIGIESDEAAASKPARGRKVGVKAGLAPRPRQSARVPAGPPRSLQKRLSPERGERARSRPSSSPCWSAGTVPPSLRSSRRPVGCPTRSAVLLRVH